MTTNLGGYFDAIGDHMSETFYITLMRHGHAQSVASMDALRPLSEKGEINAKKMASNQSQHLASVDLMLVSPYLRAQETADIVTPFCGAVERLVSDIIIPSGVPQLVIDHLYDLFKQKENVRHILLVTHNPFVSDLAASLCGRYDMTNWDFGTSAMAAFKTEVVATDCCEFRWLENIT